MHAQIREVIEKLKMDWTGKRVVLVLTAGERSPLGTILSRVYYNTDITSIINRDELFGYPHNGGQHTFTFMGTAGDAVALVELIKETMLEKFTFDEETRRVVNEMSFISQEILLLKRNNA